ncbi:countin-3-like [Haliotis rubra]|uniref:countin-3-like n=1 Tax=Haliotis rubra TaxID=36100 RepID=UPI001EE5FC86|nr:countin-3-like [Haliotis rubra]
MNVKGVTIFLGVLVGVQCLPSFFHHAQTQEVQITGSEALGTPVKCETCIHFTRNVGVDLLGIILNTGTHGSCEKLCALLRDKSQAPMCGRLCKSVGLVAFAKHFQKADTNPFYFCELITLCPGFDDGDAQITELSIDPSIAPQGKRTISYSYTSNKGTGTGEAVLLVETIDGYHIDDSVLIPKSPPGTYRNSVTLTTIPRRPCDPNKEACEKWVPGNYTLFLGICNGRCGANFPHSKIYDMRNTTFVISA